VCDVGGCDVDVDVDDVDGVDEDDVDDGEEG
jgi:hypothetical protein